MAARDLGRCDFSRGQSDDGDDDDESECTVLCVGSTKHVGRGSRRPLEFPGDGVKRAVFKVPRIPRDDIAEYALIRVHRRCRRSSCRK